MNYGQYYFVIILSLSDFSEAKPDADFTTKSYFGDFVYFEADEGKTPSNELNISIEIIDDEVFEERERFAVIIEVSTPLYCFQPSTKVYIYENDGINCYI